MLLIDIIPNGGLSICMRGFTMPSIKRENSG